MTVEQHSGNQPGRPGHPAADPQRLAAAARSILSCPSDVQVVVEGVDDVLSDQDGPDALCLQDLGGVPTFSCRPGTAIVDAARRGRRALLTLSSGLGPTGGAGRDGVLTLGGRLVAQGREDCACCDEQREVLTLVVDLVVLSRASAPDTQRVRVPLRAFHAPGLDLNRGFLQRSVEHANTCHLDELRRAVSTRTGTRLAEVIGVALAGLDRDGVDVQWVTPEGAHSHRLTFPRPATSTSDLGELLRSGLHAGLC